MIPRILLAVEGSERTFSCVAVVPSTGVAVGSAEGGMGVSNAGRENVGGCVAVVPVAVIVEAAPISGRALQPVPNMRTSMRNNIILEDTVWLFRSNGEDLDWPIFINELR